MPGRKGQSGGVHEPDAVRNAAIVYWNMTQRFGKNRAAIARQLIADGLLTVPPSTNTTTAFDSATRKIRSWVQSYEDKKAQKRDCPHLSDRQYEAQRKRKAEEEDKNRAANVVKRRRAQGMTLAERTFMALLLTEKPGTTTSELAFQLSNQFGSTWARRTIQNNRKAMGFNAKVSSPKNRASCPVTRNMYKNLWHAYGLQPWQVRCIRCAQPSPL